MAMPRIVALICLAWLLAPSLAFSAGTIKVNTSIKPPFSRADGTGFFDLIIKELGRRMNRNMELVRLPLKERSCM